jgi:hypothetical protein
LDANHSFVQSLYQDALGRSAAPAELDLWQSELVRAGATAVGNGIERSPEARRRLVKSWYVQFLGRSGTPSDGDVQVWVNGFMNGLSEEQVLAMILSSDEFFQRAQSLVGTGTANERLVQALYNLLLNRTASPGEVTGWVNALGSLGRQGVALALLTSAEYRGIVVASYYRSLLHRGSPPSQPEINGWVFSGFDLTSIRVSFESSLEFFLNG